MVEAWSDTPKKDLSKTWCFLVDSDRNRSLSAGFMGSDTKVSRKLSLSLPDSIRVRLKALSEEAGVDLEDYASAVLSGVAIGTGASSPQGRRVGRPVTVLADDQPDGLARASNATGFEGVVVAGRLYTAKVGRAIIGRFSTPELAAVVRHYAIRAFRAGRVTFLREQGLGDMAEQMAESSKFELAVDATLPGEKDQGEGDE